MTIEEKEQLCLLAFGDVEPQAEFQKWKITFASDIKGIPIIVMKDMQMFKDDRISFIFIWHDISNCYVIDMKSCIDYITFYSETCEFDFFLQNVKSIKVESGGMLLVDILVDGGLETGIVLEKI